LLAGQLAPSTVGVVHRIVAGIFRDAVRSTERQGVFAWLQYRFLVAGRGIPCAAMEDAICSSFPIAHHAMRKPLSVIITRLSSPVDAPAPTALWRSGAILVTWPATCPSCRIRHTP